MKKQKKQKKLFAIVALMLTGFIVVSFWLFQRSAHQIRDGYMASEGSAAESFAVLTAKNIRLTDQQVETLKNYTYSELLASAENRALAELVDDESIAIKVDYAYVMICLKRAEVQYYVTEENRDRFDAPVGTPLDIMWLLDVNVSDDAAQSELNNAEDVLTRYSYYIQEDAQILSGKPTHVFNSSEWGDHICGYAPLYSVEGHYIGAVGVELQTGNFNAYYENSIKTLGTLMVVSLLLLSLVFLYVYQQYRIVQEEKNYTDVLTGLQNRTYYNDRFVKYMNAHKKSSGCFALMIADIDFFKKVNDTFGHEIGDQVLIEMGNILLANFDKKQIFRFGGEEFVAGGWISGEEELRGMMERLFAAVNGHSFTTLQIPVTLSAGCCFYEADKVDGWLISNMLRAADCKLYECKENGRKHYRMEKFDPEKKYTKG